MLFFALSFFAGAQTVLVEDFTAAWPPNGWTVPQNGTN